MLRLNKYIANSGVCSRRKADELIQNGVITVNGKEIRDLGVVIDETKDEVSVYGKKIKLEEKKVYIMLNKPKGYITTNDEQFNRPCTTELIHENERVFPVGRLDMDTEGLLILTNDGEFANKLTHPKNKIEKVYVAKVDKKVNNDMIQKLEAGVDIGDYITKPAKIKVMPDNTIEITISEGKNRQVRRMCEAIDLNVLGLKRVRIGKITLGNLKIGEYRILSKAEIESIK